MIDSVVGEQKDEGQQRSDPMWLQDKEAPNGLSSLLWTSEAVDGKSRLPYEVKSATLKKKKLSFTACGQSFAGGKGGFNGPAGFFTVAAFASGRGVGSDASSFLCRRIDPHVSIYTMPRSQRN